MKKIKIAFGAGVTTIALALGFALPAAAQQATTCANGVAGANVCPNVDVNNSRNYTITLGNCSAIITNNVTQEQTVVAATDQANANGATTGAGVGGAGTGAGVGTVGEGTGTGTGGAGTGTATNDQSNTATTTATGNQTSGVTFSPDCSTHNVTNITQAAAPVSTPVTGGMGSGGAVLAASTSKVAAATTPQVQAPQGGVGAGAGGAAPASLGLSLVGVVGSVGTMGLGLVLRKWNDA